VIKDCQCVYIWSSASTPNDWLNHNVIHNHFMETSASSTSSPMAHRIRVRQLKHTPKMIDHDPLNAHPLPGTSRFLTSERDLCVPPSYTAQQAPPPYPSRNGNDESTQPSTTSVPFGSGVTFKWNPNTPCSLNDITIVTVRVNQLGRRQSFDDPLPERCACPER
jgi:hypothetical protein